MVKYQVELLARDKYADDSEPKSVERLMNLAYTPEEFRQELTKALIDLGVEVESMTVIKIETNNNT